MTEVDLYDRHYGNLDADPHVAVRRQTYDEDLGQASWITVAEACQMFRALELGPGRVALEVACGSGGVTCRMADAARRLPFPDDSFDAVFCNDSINHLPGRLEVLRDWHRVIRPGGRLLFTDPIVVTGQPTNEEIRARASIGFFLFTPLGCNERLLAESGFLVHEVRDLTEAVASVSGRWRDAREEQRAALLTLEGDEGFDGLQRFLDAVHTLASERRLSRFMYLAGKPSRLDA